jgi:drug/metabolite transporter (DMT)-like permease
MRRSDLGLLGVGVVAVSTSAPLIREADAPALAIASWRNLLAAGALAAVVAVAHRRTVRRLDRRERRLVLVAGLLLGGHFATWVPSVERTTVASSVALVSTQPVWAALLARRRGRAVGRAARWGIGLSVAGVLLLSGVDVRADADALVGDALALAGGVLAAGYVTAGAEVRRTVPNAVYTFGCYAVAGLAIAAVAVAAGEPMAGFDGRTWWVIAAITAGPQLLGHSVFNRVLPAVGPVVVSVAVLLEVLGAALLAWWWSDEVPPAAAVPAAALLLAGVGLVVVEQRARPPVVPVVP